MAMKELQDFPKTPSELMEIIIIIMIITLFSVGAKHSYLTVNIMKLIKANF